MIDYFLYLFNQQNTESQLNLSVLKSLADFDEERKFKSNSAIAIFSMTTDDVQALKSALYEQSLIQGFDYCLLQKAKQFGPFKLAVFDMDSTLIPIEVIDQLAVEAGVGQEVAKITEAAMRGELDFNQSLECRVKQLKGLPMDSIRVVKEQLVFNKGVEVFCRYIVQQGGEIAIASGGFMPFAEELATRLPFTRVRANTLLDDGECLTGEVSHPIVNAQVKAASLKEWAADTGITEQQCIAVGDGANDLKMLQQAGIGVAFKAKPTLGQSADCVLNVGYLDSLVELLPLIEKQHTNS
ncbi:MAG: phosphoserine phosphatase SerB [Kangiella sp.]|nr:phosphoserine phosphatase SerB [Kangiella sp.]